MKLLEKLGVKSIQREYNRLTDSFVYYEDKVRQLESEKNEILEALIDQCAYLSNLYAEISPTENEYADLLRKIMIIEKTTGKTWEEIIEILNEEK